jgi:hypothetical protein
MAFYSLIPGENPRYHYAIFLDFVLSCKPKLPGQVCHVMKHIPKLCLGLLAKAPLYLVCHATRSQKNSRALVQHASLVKEDNCRKKKKI